MHHGAQASATDDNAHRVLDAIREDRNAWHGHAAATLPCVALLAH
jgi:hypothetical protein